MPDVIVNKSTEKGLGYWMRFLKRVFVITIVIFLVFNTWVVAFAAGSVLVRYDGNKNIEVIAQNMIGMRKFDFIITADDGIVIKNMKASRDASATVAADNAFITEKNMAEGKFSGYFRDNLWELEKWKAAADDLGEEIPYSFDPNNFDIGTIVIDASRATGPAYVYVTGFVYFTGTENGTVVSVKTKVLVKEHGMQNHLIKYDANGGTDVPADQTKTVGKPLKISNTKPTKVCTLTYNANGGNVTPSRKSLNAVFQTWNTKQDGSGADFEPGASYTANETVTLYAQWKNPQAGDLPTPTREGYVFSGWYALASGGTQITEDSILTANTTLYAHWMKIEEYKVTYNANGGIDAPDFQFKMKGFDLTLSSKTPSKTCKISYVPNGGVLSETGKEVSATFDVWNTETDGTGVSYAAGSYYVIDKNLTLYAQWKNPKAGNLAVPTRDGYTFVGWFTSVSGGKQVNEDTEIKTDTFLYARWSTFIAGDVSGDGEVTAEDARFALRAAVGLDDSAEGLDFSDPQNRCFLAADVDGEAGITAADARLILRAAVGLETLT